MKTLPKVGDRIIVYGITKKAKVESILWDSTSFDWIIKLDWGDFGNSKVKLHDENKIWYRWSETN
jgi:hypothetical protein